MAKDTSKYGVAIIPENTFICTIEKGGDKDDIARYRFTETGKRTSKQIITIVTDDIILPDLYGEPWVRTPQGWVKAGDKITWYNSYEEARKVYKKLTKYNQKLTIYICLTAIAAIIGYLIYKYKHTPHEIQMV